MSELNDCKDCGNPSDSRHRLHHETIAALTAERDGLKADLAKEMQNNYRCPPCRRDEHEGHFTGRGKCSCIPCVAQEFEKSDEVLKEVVVGRDRLYLKWKAELQKSQADCAALKEQIAALTAERDGLKAEDERKSKIIREADFVGRETVKKLRDENDKLSRAVKALSVGRTDEETKSLIELVKLAVVG